MKIPPLIWIAAFFLLVASCEYVETANKLQKKTCCECVTEEKPSIEDRIRREKMKWGILPE